MFVRLPFASPKFESLFFATPNSAALERYGDYQVNLFTGVPDISIPLYEIQAGDLKVPVSLSYHASGIKVTDVASRVGLGWSLNAGGAITRNIMGNGPDERYLSGYLYTNLRHPSTLKMNSDSDLRYVDNIRMGVMDVEPDIFSYNFPGKSGKFFFNRMGTDKIQLVPFSPIKINKTVTTGNNTNNLSFTINDESGNQFNFGQAEREISNFGQSNSSSSSWMLEKMISQNRKDTVSFSYTSSTLDVSDLTMFQTVSDNIINNDGGNTPAYSSGWDSYATTNPIISSTYQKQLQQINFKDGRLTFGLSVNNRLDVQNTNVKSLNSIKVYSYDFGSKQYILQKAITFYQSYFTGLANDYSTKRLRLDSVCISDAVGIVTQRYRFDYDNSLAVAPYTTFSRDYWGYYNNRSNSSLIPQQQVYINGDYYSENVLIGSNNPIGREPDPNYLKLCMLKTITYPTGGYTDFEYEANRYTENGTEKVAGGIRIKSIKSYTGSNSLPLVKTYKYENARKNYILENFSFQKEQTYRYYGAPDYGIGGTTLVSTKRLRTFVSQPTIDPAPFDGATVVYPIVTEYIGDENINTGKTIFRFRDREDEYFGTWPVFDKPVVNSYFYARGQLSEKSVHVRKNDGTYQIVRRETYEYSAFPATWNGAVVGLTAAKNVINEGDMGSDVYLGVSTDGWIGPGENDLYSYSYIGYPIVSDDNYLTSQSITDYDKNDTTKFVNSTTKYEYDNILHQQVSRIITTDSKGIVKTTFNKYPADYLPAQATSTGNFLLDTMLSKNMQAAPIETYQAITITSGMAITNGTLKGYKQINTNAIELENIKKLEVTAPVNDFQLSNVLSGLFLNDVRYKNVISYDKYDASANLVQYTPRNGQTTAVFYDYNKVHPIAEAINAASNEIFFENFEEVGTTGNSHTGKRFYNGDYILAFSSPAGKTYKYSYWYREGGIWKFSGELNFTGNVALTTGDAIDDVRVYPTSALMTTYTIDPLIGTTSQCDANNRVTYYEYDSMSRLKLIRDQDKKIIKTFDYKYQQ